MILIVNVRTMLSNLLLIQTFGKSLWLATNVNRWNYAAWKIEWPQHHSGLVHAWQHTRVGRTVCVNVSHCSNLKKNYFRKCPPKSLVYEQQYDVHYMCSCWMILCHSQPKYVFVELWLYVHRSIQCSSNATRAAHIWVHCTSDRYR